MVDTQPRTQDCSRYPSDQRRLGTERDRQIFPTSLTGDVNVTSHPKSPRTTGNEAGGYNSPGGLFLESPRKLFTFAVFA